MTHPINSPDNAVANAYAAIRADDMRIAEEWADARTPWQAVAQRCSPETRARRSALFAALRAAQAAASTRRGNKKLLNSAGRPQATLAPAVMNNISIAPSKTVEQVATAVIRSSQINRPAKGSKKVAV
jgi:hypothetical protein